MTFASSSSHPANRIIVALDRPDLESALPLVDRLPDVRWWKVGLELFVAEGPAAIAAIKERGKKIFLDLKLHDIPNTVRGAVRSATRHGIDLLTVHGQGGSAMLEAAVEGAADSDCQLLAITVLTSIAPRQLALELHVPLELEEYVLKLALLAQESQLAGVVCSPQEVATLRRMCGPDFRLVTPGIRPAGGDLQDQRRTLTPTEAISAGSSQLVIGRPITAAPDPAVAFASICQELESKG